jgi:hypothetical protein
MASRGELSTEVMQNGRLGWTDGTTPPRRMSTHLPREGAVATILGAQRL